MMINATDKRANSHENDPNKLITVPLDATVQTYQLPDDIYVKLIQEEDYYVHEDSI